MTVNLTKAPTFEQALALLDAIVEERGADYVYPPGICVYVDAAGGPRCGIGLALVRHGVDPDLLWSDSNAQRLLDWTLWPRHLTGGVDERVVDLFLAFQTHQDSRYTWGASRDYAVYAVEYVRDTHGTEVS